MQDSDSSGLVLISLGEEIEAVNLHIVNLQSDPRGHNFLSTSHN